MNNIFPHAEPLLPVTVYLLDARQPFSEWTEAAEELLRTRATRPVAIERLSASISPADTAQPASLVLRAPKQPVATLQLLNESSKNPHIRSTVVLGAELTVDLAVAIMKVGVSDLLAEPCAPTTFRAAVRRAAQTARTRYLQAQQHDELQARLAALTPRELEVLRLLAAGETNASIGFRLGISERTVEVHRKHVIRKTRAENTVRLVQMFWLTHGLSGSAAESCHDGTAGGRFARP